MEPALDNLARPVTMVVVMEVAGVQEVLVLLRLAEWEESQVEAVAAVGQKVFLEAAVQAGQAEMELSESFHGR